MHNELLWPSLTVNQLVFLRVFLQHLSSSLIEYLFLLSHFCFAHFLFKVFRRIVVLVVVVCEGHNFFLPRFEQVVLVVVILNGLHHLRVVLLIFHFVLD